MSFDEDPLDLLEDDGDGVVEMGLFFDKDGENQNSQKSPQGTGSGCAVILFFMGAGVAPAGIFFAKLIA